MLLTLSIPRARRRAVPFLGLVAILLSIAIPHSALAAGVTKAKAINWTTDAQELVASTDTASVTLLVPANPNAPDGPPARVDFKIGYGKVPFTATAVWTNQVTGAVVTCSKTITSKAGTLTFQLPAPDWCQISRQIGE